MDLEYRIENLNTVKKLRDLDFKDIVMILNQLAPDSALSNQIYWNAKLIGTGFDRNVLFTTIFCDKLLPRKAKNYMWKLYYGLVYVEKKLKVIKLSDGNCRICLTEQEDFEHTIWQC